MRNPITSTKVAITTVIAMVAQMILPIATQSVSASTDSYYSVSPSQLHGYSEFGSPGRPTSGSPFNGYVSVEGSFSHLQKKSGNGSYRFVTGEEGGKQYIFKRSYNGTQLGQISELKYSTFVDSSTVGTTVAPTLRIDTMLGGVSTTLVYEPVYTSSIVKGVWQDWDVLSSNADWWSTKPIPGFTAGGQAIADMFTFAEVQAEFPTAVIQNETDFGGAAGGLQLQVGQNTAGAPWSNLIAYVDNLIVGIAGGVTTYDFEIDAPSTPENGAPHASYLNTNDFWFTWDASTGNGDVTYTFQSSTNPAEVGGVLTSPMFTEAGISATSLHSIGAPDATWYWQVKAVDSLGLESGWSEIWNVTLDTVNPSDPGNLGWLSPNLACSASTTSYTITATWDASVDVNPVSYQYAVLTPLRPTWDDAWVTTVSTNSYSGAFTEGEGTYTFRVRAMDAAGNYSGWSNTCDVFYISAASAKVMLISPENDSYVTGAVLTNSWQAVEGAVAYHYQSFHDEAGTSLRFEDHYTTTSKTATNVADATFWWQVRAQFDDGSYGDWSDRWKVTVDSTAPDTVITAPADDATVGGTLAINGEITEPNLLRYYFFIANETGSVVYGPYTAYGSNVASYSWDTTAVPDGRYKIQLEARDKAGNKDAGSTDVVWVTVHNTVESVSILTPYDGQYFKTTPILNLWTPSSSPHGIEKYQVEYIYDDGHTFTGGPYREVPGTQTFRNHTPGVGEQGGVTIRVRAFDTLGNMSDWSEPVWYVFDSIAPTAPTNGQPHNQLLDTNEFMFTWDAATDMSPVTYVFQSSMNPAQVDGVLTTSLWTSGTLTLPQIWSSGAPDGTWYWQVRATDAAGNVGPWSEIWQVTLDTTAPAAPVNGQPHDVFVDSDTVTFTWDGVTDPAAPVTYDFQLSQIPLPHIPAAVDPTGTRLMGLSSPEATVAGLADGVWYWYVRAVDAAGNEGPWSEVWFFTVDTTAPVATLSAPTNGSTVSGMVTITGTITEENPATYTVTVFSGTTVVFSDTLPGTAVSILWDSTSVSDGEYAVVLTATDEAGNVSNLSTANVTVSNAVPTPEPTPTPAPASETTPTPAPLAAPAGTPAGGTGGPVPGQDIDVTDDEAADSEEATLAAQSTPGASDDEDGEVAGATDEATSRSWLWWLLLIPAALIFWFIMKRRNEEQA